MPDGTIPPAGATLGLREQGQDTFSGRPVAEARRDPLAEEPVTQLRQENEGIKPVESTESTIPLPGQPRGASPDVTESIPAHANDLQPSTKSSKIQSLLAGHDRDVFYTRSVESQPEPSARPRAEIPKAAANAQGSDSHVEVGRLNQDVFYATPKPGQRTGQTGETAQAAPPVEEDVPEGINTDIFHSKRVARMLGQDRYSRKEHLGPTISKGTGRHPLDDRPIVQAGHSAKLQPSRPVQSSASTTDQEMQNFASELAKDAEAQAAAAATEVRTTSSL